jgi:hypothetical protein
MKSQIVRELLALIEARVASRPSPIEYEMAYQVRVAIDRLRFAITQVEKMGGSPEGCRETVLQLLDALDRLKAADLKFQIHFREPRVSGLTPNGLVEQRDGCVAESTREAT